MSFKLIWKNGCRVLCCVCVFVRVFVFVCLFVYNLVKIFRLHDQSVKIMFKYFDMQRNSTVK